MLQQLPRKTSWRSLTRTSTWWLNFPELLEHNRAELRCRMVLTEIRLRLLSALAIAFFRRHGRSEEHTSELQSHSDHVCRLLLEKKKKNMFIVIEYFIE